MRRKAQLAGAAQWLAELDHLVVALAREWGLALGTPFVDGTEAFVIAVTTSAGADAVLKVVLPQGDDAVRHEITTLRLADGDGCVRLLGADVGRGALLTERLGPSLHDHACPHRERERILCELAMRVWRPATGHGLPTRAEKAAWLDAFVTSRWELLDRPVPLDVLMHARSCAARRRDAHDDGRAQLVHGDIHEWNALSTGDGFALIDPDGLLAEPEYDLGVLMREDPVELVAEGSWTRADRLAGLTGRDPVAIWEWGVVERLATGLLLSAVGVEPVGRQMLDAASAVAAGA